MATNNDNYEKLLQDSDENDSQKILDHHHRARVAYSIAIVFNLIGYIIILGAMISIIKKTAENNSLFVASNYLAHETLYILFSFLVIIYVLICIVRKKFLRDLYIFLVLIALSGCGTIFFSGSYISSQCENPDFIVCAENICYIVGSLIFAIASVFLIAYKEITKPSSVAKNPERFYKFLFALSLVSLVIVLIILCSQIYITAMTVSQYEANLFDYSYPFIFLNFAIFISIYGIFCGFKKKKVTFMYSIFLAFVFFFWTDDIFIWIFNKHLLLFL